MSSSSGQADSTCETRVHASFARQKVMAMLGASLRRVTAGQVDIFLPYREDLTQQHGLIHAGIVTTVADSACGYAALTLMPPGAAVLTVEFKVNLIAPAGGEGLVGHGRVLKAGRTLTVCNADVVMLEGGQERLVATMMATLMAIRDRPGLTD